MNEAGRIVPFQPLDLAQPAELVASIRERRGGELLNLDRMLLHSVPLATGWNAFLKGSSRFLGNRLQNSLDRA